MGVSEQVQTEGDILGLGSSLHRCKKQAIVLLTPIIPKGRLMQGVIEPRTIN